MKLKIEMVLCPLLYCDHNKTKTFTKKFQTRCTFKYIGNTYTQYIIYHIILIHFYMVVLLYLAIMNYYNIFRSNYRTSRRKKTLRVPGTWYLVHYIHTYTQYLHIRELFNLVPVNIS